MTTVLYTLPYTSDTVPVIGGGGGVFSLWQLLVEINRVIAIIPTKKNNKYFFILF